MIKQNKKAPVIAAMAFTTLLSQAAWANNEETTLSAPVFQADELSAAFDQSAEPMQMLALSEQEMKDTEGAVVPQIIVWASPHLARGGFGAIGGASSYIGGWAGGGYQWNTWDAAKAVGGGFVGGVVGGRTNLGAALWGSFAGGVASSWNGGFWR